MEVGAPVETSDVLEIATIASVAGTACDPRSSWQRPFRSRTTSWCSTRWMHANEHNFAYARRVPQQRGGDMPNAFLLPLSKTAAWWSKIWMERHGYFLPRFAESGERTSEGHALVCEPGIACLMRRTYRQTHEPAPGSAYDFINYFECSDAHVPTFHAICAGLRDLKRNPEWRYVLEGPTWHGRRVATWQELSAPAPHRERPHNELP